MNKQTRNLVAIAAVALIAVTTTGCSAGISYEEAEAAEHRVMQAESSTFEGQNWVYIGPVGPEVPLTENCNDDLSSPTCRASVDGSIMFHYTSGKNGALVRESITVNGEQYEADCAEEVEGLFGVGYICAPIPTN